MTNRSQSQNLKSSNKNLQHAIVIGQNSRIHKDYFACDQAFPDCRLPDETILHRFSQEISCDGLFNYEL